MIMIGICDGEQMIRSQISGYVRRYQEETGMEVQLLAYSSGEKLLKNYMLDLDVIFLEVPFGKSLKSEISGLDVARRMRGMDAGVRIVFLTTVLSWVLQAYEVGADNYLLKPLDYGRFCREISRVCEAKSSLETMSFVEQNKNGVYKIYLQQIRYIETFEKNTRIHLKKEAIVSYRKMKQHEQLMEGTSLVRCHAGFIVNLRYFQKMEGSLLYLTDGTAIPVSRSKKAVVLERIQFFYGKGMEE